MGFLELNGRSGVVIVEEDHRELERLARCSRRTFRNQHAFRRDRQRQAKVGELEVEYLGCQSDSVQHGSR